MPALAPAKPAPPPPWVLRRAYALSAAGKAGTSAPLGAPSSLRTLRRLQLEPEEPARSEGQQVRQLPDRREAGASEHLLGDHTGVRREVELYGLGRAREIVDAENDVLFPLPN